MPDTQSLPHTAAPESIAVRNAQLLMLAAELTDKVLDGADVSMTARHTLKIALMDCLIDELAFEDVMKIAAAHAERHGAR